MLPFNPSHAHITYGHGHLLVGGATGGVAPAVQPRLSSYLTCLWLTGQSACLYSKQIYMIHC